MHFMLDLYRCKLAYKIIVRQYFDTYAYVPTLLHGWKAVLGQDTHWVRSVVSKCSPQGKCPQQPQAASLFHLFVKWV